MLQTGEGATLCGDDGAVVQAKEVRWTSRQPDLDWWLLTAQSSVAKRRRLSFWRSANSLAEAQSEENRR